MKPKHERRMQLKQRADIDKTVQRYLGLDYEITSTDPLTLTRGRSVQYLENGVFKDGTGQKLRRRA